MKKEKKQTEPETSVIAWIVICIMGIIFSVGAFTWESRLEKGIYTQMVSEESLLRERCFYFSFQNGFYLWLKPETKKFEAEIYSKIASREFWRETILYHCEDAPKKGLLYIKQKGTKFTLSGKSLSNNIKREYDERQIDYVVKLLNRPSLLMK